VPPLRERKDDILVFARHFLTITNKELEKNVKGFSKEVEEIFRNYVWYGNLRELKNVVKRATLLTEGTLVELHTLPFEISNFAKLQFDESPGDSYMQPVSTEIKIPVVTSSQPSTPSFLETDHQPVRSYSAASSELSLKNASIDAEYETIIEALKKSNFNKSKAAKLLNIDRKTLYNKMKQYQEFNSH
jgi:two-component system response regulator HydG